MKLGADLRARVPLPVKRRIRSLQRWTVGAARRMVKPTSLVVLMYHGVGMSSRDAFALRVRREHFGEQLEALTSLAPVVPLTTNGEHDGPRIAITFDDGYLDNLEVALPMLEDAGMPATVFITSGNIGTSSEFWWDRLEHLVLGSSNTSDSLEVVVGDREHRYSLARANERHRALQDLWSVTVTRPMRVIESVLEQVEAQVGSVGPVCSAHRRMTSADQIRRLTDSGLVDVGGHSRSHTMLSAISEQEQWDEIIGGKRVLEEIVERPIRFFAYPFGGTDSYDTVTPALVERAGFEAAFTTSYGRVTRTSARYLLPRVQVKDWGGEEFSYRVQRALDAV